MKKTPQRKTKLSGLEEMLRAAEPTLETSLEPPRGLRERLKFTAEVLEEAGPLSAEPQVIWRQPDGKVRAQEIHAELRVGREIGLELVIASPKASRRHFSIHSEKGLAVLKDHQSRNGTYVNGTKVDQRQLLDGDIIEAGGRLFVFLQRLSEK